MTFVNGEYYEIAVKMTKPITYTAPTLRTGSDTYNGQSKNILATAGSATGGTMYYSYRHYRFDTSTWGDWSDWSTTAPMSMINAGTYKVRYKVESNAGYSGGVDATEIGSFTINKANGWCSLSSYSSTGWGNEDVKKTEYVTISHHGGALSASKNGYNSNFLSVSFNGNTMTLFKDEYYQAEKVKVTVYSAATMNYNAASAQFTCND